MKPIKSSNMMKHNENDPMERLWQDIQADAAKYAKRDKLIRRCALGSVAFAVIVAIWILK
jgi:hypothetical protein